jgi:hypothetical protein
MRSVFGNSLFVAKTASPERLSPANSTRGEGESHFKQAESQQPGDRLPDPALWRLKAGASVVLARDTLGEIRNKLLVI